MSRGSQPSHLGSHLVAPPTAPPPSSDGAPPRQARCVPGTRQPQRNAAIRTVVPGRHVHPLPNPCCRGIEWCLLFECPSRPICKEKETERLRTLERSRVQRRASRVVRGGDVSAIVEQHLHRLLRTCNTGQTPSGCCCMSVARKLSSGQHTSNMRWKYHMPTSAREMGVRVVQGPALGTWTKQHPSEPALPLASAPLLDQIGKLKTVDCLKH